MEWRELKEIGQLEALHTESYKNPVLIFKHSNRCSISRMSLDRLERNWEKDEMNSVHPYFLDLINHRSVSNSVAEKFDVEHESPQVIIIDKGQTVFTSSHMAIDYHAIREAIKN